MPLLSEYPFGVVRPSFEEGLRRRVAVAMATTGLSPVGAFAAITSLVPAPYRRVCGNFRSFLRALRGTGAHNNHLVRTTERWIAKVAARAYEADAAALKTWRTERGLSPTQLAARLRISTSTLYKLERGRHAPRRAVQQRIRRSLGLSLFVGQA